MHSNGALAQHFSSNVPIARMVDQQTKTSPTMPVTYTCTCACTHVHRCIRAYLCSPRGLPTLCGMTRHYDRATPPTGHLGRPYDRPSADRLALDAGKPTRRVGLRWTEPPLSVALSPPYVPAFVVLCLCACACVCVRACACVHVRVRACARACSRASVRAVGVRPI